MKYTSCFKNILQSYPQREDVAAILCSQWANILSFVQCTASVLAHGIVGRSNPMGSVRYTNHKKEAIRMDGFFFGDPYGNRTHVTAVKGRCLNRLTNGPGSGNLTRTDDTPGMNRMLYQLSYAAIFLLCLTARDIISAKKRFVNNFCSVFSRFQKVFSASSTNSPKTPSRQGPVTRTQRI